MCCRGMKMSRPSRYGAFSCLAYGVDDRQILDFHAVHMGKLVDLLKFTVSDRLTGGAVDTVVVVVCDRLTFEIFGLGRLIDSHDIPAVGFVFEDALDLCVVVEGHVSIVSLCAGLCKALVH